MKAVAKRLWTEQQFFLAAVLAGAAGVQAIEAPVPGWLRAASGMVLAAGAAAAARKG